MTCPDRNNDAIIIAEIEKRKTIIEKEPVYEYHTWVGNLFDIQLFNIDIDNIVNIEHYETGEWVAKIRLYK